MLRSNRPGRNIPHGTLPARLWARRHHRRLVEAGPGAGGLQGRSGLVLRIRIQTSFFRRRPLNHALAQAKDITSLRVFRILMPFLPCVRATSPVRGPGRVQNPQERSALRPGHLFSSSGCAPHPDAVSRVLAGWLVGRAHASGASNKLQEELHKKKCPNSPVRSSSYGFGWFSGYTTGVQWLHHRGSMVTPAGGSQLTPHHVRPHPTAAQTATSVSGGIGEPGSFARAAWCSRHTRWLCGARIRIPGGGLRNLTEGMCDTVGVPTGTVGFHTGRKPHNDRTRSPR